MSYNGRIEESRERAYNHLIATKILDLMGKLRLDSNENSPRRWIWELIQNAKDVAHEKNDISIEIDFREKRGGVIEFKHNGKPFSVDNLIFLIEQVSTKDRNPENTNMVKTTGKFGTGFLTTHLLSEKVEVEGVIKELDEPYRKFNLALDRSSKTIEGIIRSVNNSMESVDKIDENPILDKYSPCDFNTVFRYNLDESGIEVAKIGLRDLNKSLMYALVFSTSINRVRLVHEEESYKLSREISDEGNDIKIYTVLRKTANETLETKIALLRKNDTSIAVEIENKSGRIFIKEFDPLVPRLFCDFPLVGTENFPFPVIINSIAFNPNEPRDGVYLTDKSGVEIIENKRIVGDAMDLYFTLLEHASARNWGNIHLLANIPLAIKKDWFSNEWIEKSVLNPIKERLLKTPIVDTENNGRVPIVGNDDSHNIWFPYSPNKVIRSKMWDLTNSMESFMLPRKSDIDIWYGIKWIHNRRLTLKEITKKIQQQKTLSDLADILDRQQTNPVDWLNEYFELVSLDEEFIEQIATDKYIIIPNQNGDFKKRSSLVKDSGIEEELKNALAILDSDPREYLLHCDLETKSIHYSVKEQNEVIEDINKVISGVSGR